VEDDRLALLPDDRGVTMSDQPHHSTSDSATGRGISPADVVAGASSLVMGKAILAARAARPLLGSVGRTALRPPLVPPQLQPVRVVAIVAGHGAARRHALQATIARALDELVPQVLAEVLRRARLTEMIVRYVDLDAVVAAADLDAAARRLDVAAILDRVDVDEVVRRVDVAAVVDRVDVDAVVGRADFDAILDRVDVDAVARRLDLEAVLDRPELTAAILRHLDLDALVEAILAHVDLVALAEEIIDGVDLPEIIRDSTGAMASDTVRGARMQGIAADEAVGRAVDRLLLRRGRRTTPVPVGPEAPTDQSGHATIPFQSDARH
jgi:hypothetical protein